MIEYSDISIVSNSKNSKDRYIHVLYKESTKGKPYWTYSFENKNNGDYWENGDTIKVEVRLKRSLKPGSYTIRFTTYNGFTASDLFSTGRR
jgi:methionine-rich copper-binding protein CopC